MADIVISEIRTDSEIERVYPVIKALRTELSFQDYIAIYKQAKSANGYTLVGAYAARECVALMGYRILHDFVHGAHLYIDDLVTLEKFRSTGIGAALLKHAIEIASKKSCSGLRLSTGIANGNAKRFYEREGWQQRAVVFKKKLH
jgi:GNAT superfamily N-acetyltransferase